MKNLKMSLFVASLSLVVRLAGPALGNDWNDERDLTTGAPVGPAWEFSVLGGGAIPVGDNSNGFNGDYGTSGLIQGSMIHNINSTFGFGVEVGHSFNHAFNFNMDPNSQFWLDPKDSVEITQLTPVLQVGRWIGPIKPYATLGGGLYSVKETLSFNDFTSRLSETATTNEAGFNVGVGLLARLGNNLAVGPDIRYHKLLGNDFHFDYVTTTVRLALLF